MGMFELLAFPESVPNRFWTVSKQDEQLSKLVAATQMHFRGLAEKVTERSLSSQTLLAPFTWVTPQRGGLLGADDAFHSSQREREEDGVIRVVVVFCVWINPNSLSWCGLCLKLERPWSSE